MSTLSLKEEEVSRGGSGWEGTPGPGHGQALGSPERGQPESAGSSARLGNFEGGQKGFHSFKFPFSELRSDCLDRNPGSATYWTGDFGQGISWPRALVSPHVKWGRWQSLPHSGVVTARSTTRCNWPYREAKVPAELKRLGVVGSRNSEKRAGQG